jgi:hypothetical protein
MHRVIITKSNYDFDADQWTTETVSSFVVGPNGIEHVDEGADRIPRRVTVVDPSKGDDVSLESDPERWAVLLPSAFRSGDLTITVDADRPIETEAVPAPDREPVLAEAVAFQVIRHP